MRNGRKLSADPPSAGIEITTHPISATNVIHCLREGARPSPPPPRIPCMKPVTYSTTNATSAAHPTTTHGTGASERSSAITG